MHIKNKTMKQNNWPYTVRKSDLKIDFYKGSGPGGQHRNKVETACRITHKQTGLSACSEKSKSQGQNKKMAFKKLSDKLILLMIKSKETAPITAARNHEVIRVYNKNRNTVKDKRISKIWTYDEILNKKGFDEIIEELKNE